MTAEDQFNRDKACYEQNAQQMRALNQIMWQVPIIAMTLTGGLWYAVAAVKGMDNVVRVALLFFAVVSNIGLVFMINRVRDVMSLHFKKMKEFNPTAFVDASAADRPVMFLRDRGVCATFSWLMSIAALLSLIGLILLLLGHWKPSP